jgi:hypothetical protein
MGSSSIYRCAGNEEIPRHIATLTPCTVVPRGPREQGSLHILCILRQKYNKFLKCCDSDIYIKKDRIMDKVGKKQIFCYIFIK